MDPASHAGCNRVQSQPVVIMPGITQTHALPVSRLTASRKALSADVLDLQLKSLAFLEAADDRKQVPGLRVAIGAEHTHQALG